MTTDWENLYKIRLSNPTEAMMKHEVVKLMIVLKLLEKHRKEKNFIRIYTEYPISELKISDVLFENFKTKECYAYEIQKNFGDGWMNKTKFKYLNWERAFMKTSDWIPIDLNELSDNIEELSEQLNRFIM